MKKNIKKITAIACAMAMTAATATSIYAEYDPNKAVVQGEMATKAVNKNTISVDGKVIENADVISQEGKTLISARAVAEALGFEVEWENETHKVILSNLPQYVTFTIGVDGYTFARTAPMPLGAAPILVDGVTYMPIEVVTELLELKVENDDNSNLNIITTEDTEESTEETTEITTEEVVNEDNTEAENNGEGEEAQGLSNAKVVSYDEEENQLLIEDEAMGEVILIANDDTVIVDKDGNAIELSDLKEGDEISVEYSDAMTMSLPPINNPVQIVLK